MAKKTPSKAPKKPARSAPAKRARPATAGKAAPAADTFGRRLKSAREAAGFTQASFGDVVGINKRVIIRYELDHAAPSVHAAARMARAVGASLDALAGLSVSAQDPELFALLAQVAGLSEEDRACARRLHAGLVKLNEKK